MRIEVTQLEAQVLTALANEMYAEQGFSDAGLDEVQKTTGLSPNIIRGVQSSLLKKELIHIDNREGEYGINPNDPRMHIWYLTAKTEGLAEVWKDEVGVEPCELIIK